MVYRFEELTSTNDEAQNERYVHGDVIVAQRQSAGRGQRGNKWLSGEGLNLTLTFVIQPSKLEAKNQFLISQITALALSDLMSSYGIETKIKWTNDIYVGDKKIVGILIENRIRGSYIDRSIVGIGINVNQEVFDASLPNPTSMALNVGRELDRDEVMERLQGFIVTRSEQLNSAQHALIESQYHDLIYRRDEFFLYRLADGNIIEGAIQGVKHSGELIVKGVDGQICGYQFKEIEFIIDTKK